LQEQELLFWLWWNRVPGIGPGRFSRLLEEFGSMQDAGTASAEQLRPLIGAQCLAAWEETRQSWDPALELQKLRHCGFRVYCQVDRNYPPLLKKISDPPPVLYIWGDFAAGDEIAVAIIGTRTPTPAGLHIAKELAGDLSRQGLTLISGMARGIDSAAHQGAIEAGGRTVAVLGCGLDICYPAENEKLMAEIAAHGAVISEFSLGMEPLAKNFPARNRIISGLSLGVVVVEAAHDSGSLITAGMALEQGREVFAVPGNIASEGSKGPHLLLRQGAKLVEDYRDILTELAIPQLTEGDYSGGEYQPVNELEAKVLAAMSREPLHVDEILRRSGLAAAQISAALVQLELGGAVKRFPGQLFLRTK
jgi:DNA processing protein